MTSQADDATWLSRGLRYMIAAAFFFSLMSLLVKVAGLRLPSQQIVLARSVVMAVLAYTALHRQRIPLWGQRRRLLLLRGLLGFAALSCFYYALVHLPLADATVLQYTNPVWAGLIAVFALGERMRPRELLCIALSIAGVLLVARPAALFGGGGLDSFAVMVGLAGAVLSGSGYVTVRMLGSEHHMVVIFYFALMSSLLSLPFAAVHSVVPTAWEWLVLLGVGVTTHIGQVFMTRGLRLERAGRATAAALVQIVFAGIWGALVFAQWPDARGLAGAALVITGVLLLGRS
ncbi:MAG TPA: DMT family transporter [Longimicrobiales bacterium]|nr:DMT family transporter [Longimicrobiales bacterium]